MPLFGELFEKKLGESEELSEAVNKCRDSFLSYASLGSGERFGAAILTQKEFDKLTHSKLDDLKAFLPNAYTDIVDSYPPAVEQILTAPEPDPYCNRSEMLDFGYTDQSMYPISTDFALELMERDVPVYMLYADNTEAMAFDSEDLAMHQGFIGVAKEDWNEVKDTPETNPITVKPKTVSMWQSSSPGFPYPTPLHPGAASQ